MMFSRKTACILVLASNALAAPQLAAAADDYVPRPFRAARGHFLDYGNEQACARARDCEAVGYWYQGYSVACYWYPNRPDCDWRYGWHWYPGYPTF